jgi:hypothetical protein
MSWLDIYPTAGGGGRSSPPKPKQDTRVTSRLNNLRETIKTLKEKIEIRQQLVGLSEMNGYYCVTCGPRPTNPFCSPTCPLLKIGRGWRPMMLEDRAWVKSAKRDVQIFWELFRDVEAHGPDANMRIVRGWEATASYLLSRTDDVFERQSEDTHPVKGLDLKWTFGENWGKGHGLENELAPDEPVCRTTD